MQQMQMYQQMQQLQFFPQNFGLLRNEFFHQVNHNMNVSLLGNTMQQLQQLQLQQKAAAASVASLGHGAALNIMQELKAQQEALINQFILACKHVNDPTVVDPAILGASSSSGVPTVGNNNSTKTSQSGSIWGEMPPPQQPPVPPQQRVSPSGVTPPSSMSPLNSLIASQASHLAAMLGGGVDSATAAALIAQQLSASGVAAGGAQFQMLNDSLIKDKIQALFEQTRKEEERKRKMEEDYQLKVKYVFLDF